MNGGISVLILKDSYNSTLSLRDTQKAIKLVRDTFEDNLAAALNLDRISAPLFVTEKSGINDDLNGVERAVSFDIKNMPEAGKAVIVHSLAKWKRLALYEYRFSEGEGLYTDMNAIRRDEEFDNLHSIYVDQWDWEKVIDEKDRNPEYLKSTVKAIVGAICDTQDELCRAFPELPHSLSREVSFVTSQELEDMYPTMTSKERENAYVKEHRTTFIMQIGGKLKSGKKHDGRAPDYDDWSLNGDIMFYNDTLGCAFEISSMGIRVSPESLDRQLTEAGADERRNLPFHKMLLEGKLPYTIGGGIGQSRLSMLLLGKAHIGEVQSSVWDAKTKEECAAAGIKLL